MNIRQTKIEEQNKPIIDHVIEPFKLICLNKKYKEKNKVK